MDIDKNIIEVTSVVFVQEPLNVVTLDVEEVDNYFAGTANILVHNQITKS
jgi:hypothetical protein